MKSRDSSRGRQRPGDRGRGKPPAAQQEIIIGGSSTSQRRENAPSSSNQKARGLNLSALVSALRANNSRLLRVIGAGALAVGLVVGGGFGIRALVRAGQLRQIVNAPVATVPVITPAANLPARDTPAPEPQITAAPGRERDLSHGAADIDFSENKTNQPGIYDTELVFSAGTGAADSGKVFTALYLYNLDTGQREKVAETGLYLGEIFETLVNHDWIVWLDSDKGTNNIIYALNRNTNAKTRIKNCTNGKPKLRLYGDTLIWMEQATKTEDYLRMINLKTQEDLTLFSFEDVATYGVSAPCVYEDWIVWAGPEEEAAATAAPGVTPAATATADDAMPAPDTQTSAIYYMQLGVDFATDGPHPRVYRPGTYVHEPLFNGEVFVWLDGNKRPGSKLYIARPGGEPKAIATGVTTYSLGDGIVVYGHDEGVWVYIYDKDETCRLTQEGERGMLPMVTGRTVVWYNLSTRGGKDVLRYIILSDNELYPERS